MNNCAPVMPVIFKYLDENYWKDVPTIDRALRILNSAEEEVANYPEPQKESVLAGVVFLALKYLPSLRLDPKIKICKYGHCYRNDCRFSHSPAMVSAAKRVFEIIAKRAEEDISRPDIYRTVSGTEVDKSTADLSITADSCASSVLNDAH